MSRRGFGSARTSLWVGWRLFGGTCAGTKNNAARADAGGVDDWRCARPKKGESPKFSLGSRLWSYRLLLEVIDLLAVVVLEEVEHAVQEVLDLYDRPITQTGLSAPIGQ